MSTDNDRVQVLLTWSPESGPQPELPVGNELFLKSYVRQGVWIRVFVARTILKRLSELSDEDRDYTPQFNALIAGLYEEVAKANEDAAATLVAWSIWATDRSLSIPDLLQRINIRSSSRPFQDASYVEAVLACATTTEKRIDVCPNNFFSELAKKPIHDLPMCLGIPWKSHPSVKLVPKNLAQHWTVLPSQICNLIRPVVQLLFCKSESAVALS